MRITDIRTYMFNVDTGQRTIRHAAAGEVLFSHFKTWLFLK